jgi:hypothetical protein
MKFDAFQKLGEEKLATIINRLVSGESTMTVARIIQEQWGDIQHLSRGALEKELTRLRWSISRGGTTCHSAEPSSSKTTDDLQLVSLDEFASLTRIQKRRVEELFKSEREQDKYLPALTTAIKIYSKMLVSHQKMRFDLGVDVYKRAKLTRQEWQAAEQAKKDAEYQHIVAAVEGLEDILNRNRPRLRAIGRQEGSHTEERESFPDGLT